MTYLPIGTPVRMTEIGVSRLSRVGEVQAGVVVGHGRSLGVLRVLRVGRKHPESWHKIYWEPMTTPEEIVKATVEAFRRVE